METIAIAAPPLWERALRGEALMQGYFAEPMVCMGAQLMNCAQDESFNLALIDDVRPQDADAALALIVDHFRRLGVPPRVRLSPLSPPGWEERLHASAFFETRERRRLWIVPKAIDQSSAPGVSVTRVSTAADADRFSAIQVAGFALPEEQHELDRLLARRRLGDGTVHYYLGRLHGRAVGTGAMMPLPNGTVGLWGLAVLPAARQMGVGLAVLARLIEDALALQAGPVFFTTAWDNPIEVAYERMGCVPLLRTRTFACPL